MEKYTNSSPSLCLACSLDEPSPGFAHFFEHLLFEGSSSGLAIWIGNQLTYLSDVPLVILLLILIASVNFLTEVTSNMATTAMLLPILVSLAVVLDLHPYYLLVSATLAASCAFMLPVATPPNTVVFGSGLLKIEDMFKKGLWLNLISIITLTFVIYFILPHAWDLITPL